MKTEGSENDIRGRLNEIYISLLEQSFLLVLDSLSVEMLMISQCLKEPYLCLVLELFEHQICEHYIW